MGPSNQDSSNEAGTTGNSNPESVERQDLHNQENGSTGAAPGTESPSPSGTGNESGGLYNPNGETGSSQGEKSLDKPGLAAAENGSGGEKLFNPGGDKKSAGDRLKSALKPTRRKSLVGGGAGLAAVVIALIFSSIIPYELSNIEHVLLNDTSKVEQKFEKKAANRVIQTVFDRLKQKTSGTTAEKAQIAQEEAAGDPLATEMDKFPITSPEVETDLAKVGITVETNAQDNFTSLEDSSGNDITDQSTNPDGVVASELETALPEYATGQIISMEPTATVHFDDPWSGVSEDDTASNVDKDITSEIENGASNADVLNAESGQESEGQQPAANDTGTTTNANGTTISDTAAAAEFANEGGALGTVLNATNQAEQAGASGEAAVEAGVKAFNPTDPVFVSGLATTACSLKQSVDKSSKQRVATIMKLLSRHFAILASLAGQLKDGKLQSGTVNKVMQLLNGDPSANPKQTNPPPEAAMPFTSSESWQAATGGNIDTNPKDPGYTPGISKSALPTANTGTQIVNEIDGVTNAVGGNFICSALTSSFGFIVQGIIGVAQVFSDLASFGLSQVAITGGILAANVTLQKVVLPDIIKYFTPVGINGTEDSVQWLNNSRAGAVLNFSDYARTIGGQPLTSAQADTLTSESNAGHVVGEARESWTTRTFALSNPDSLISRLAFDLPLSLRQALASFSSFFTNAPSILTRNFGSVLASRKASAQTVSQNAGADYGITEYGLTDAQGNYDPIQNENYLETTVTYGGKTAKRIDMAGDPSKYQNGLVDPSATDLLHCFNQGFDVGSNPTSSETSPDPICKSAGNYDLTSMAPMPMDNTSVAVAYCNYLAPGDAFCPTSQTMANQIQDDMNRYDQYILDIHVMTDYNTLATNQ